MVTMEALGGCTALVPATRAMALSQSLCVLPLLLLNRLFAFLPVSCCDVLVPVFLAILLTPIYR